MKDVLLVVVCLLVTVPASGELTVTPPKRCAGAPKTAEPDEVTGYRVATDGEGVLVNFQVDGETMNLKGWVCDAEGKPIEGEIVEIIGFEVEKPTTTQARVIKTNHLTDGTVRRVEGAYYEIPTSETGQFQQLALSPGSYILRLRRDIPGAATTTYEFQVY